MYPDYSVLMSVDQQDNPCFFRTAIESMLNQTVPANDFVLVCDGPLTPELNAVIDEISLRNKDLFQVLRLEIWGLAML